MRLMAEGVRIELTSVVLETTVLTFERTLNVILVFVCPKRQASFRFATQLLLRGTSPGTLDGIRTHTGRILSPLSASGWTTRACGVLRTGRHP